MRAIRNPALVFSGALMVRVYFFFRLFRDNPVEKFWGTGYEACHIAASLASGLGFSSPFGVPTGPSAWVPPVYTGILAAVFEMFGTYSVSAAWAMLLLNALFAASTAVAIYFAGERILGKDVGVIAAWLWAFFPYAVVMSIKIWETSLSALLVMAGLLIYERMYGLTSERSKNSRRLSDWVAWGLFWGFTTLVNPALGVFFPVLSVGAVCRDRKQWVLSLAVAGAVSCAVIAPWIARNQLELHSFIPIRSNFGEELWLGNHEGVHGPNDETRHPLGDPRELAAYRKMGEVQYIAGKQRAATEFIESRSREFANLTLRRIVYFWTSPRDSFWLILSALSFCGLTLAIKKDFLRSLPFAVALLLFPGAYYLTHSDNWYRHPIEPLMILLIVHALFVIGRRLWLIVTAQVVATHGTPPAPLMPS